MAWRRSLSASQLNPNLLAPDFDHAFPPEEMFAQRAGDVSDGDSGDDGGAAEIVTRGFGTRAHRSARPDPRGFEAVVHELDASKFWEPRRWVVRPARLLYSYAPNRDARPVAICDLDGFDAERTDLELALTAPGGERVRARFVAARDADRFEASLDLSLIHISEPTRPY